MFEHSLKLQKIKGAIDVEDDKKIASIQSESVFDFCLNENILDNFRGKKQLISASTDIQNFLLDERSGKLVYLLWKIRYSNNYELKKTLIMHHESITYFIKKLSKYRIILILRRRSEEYQVVNSFWSSQSVTSWKKGTFYYINPAFEEVIKNFEEILLSFFDPVDIANIEKRRNAWFSHKELALTARNATDMAHKNAIGYCSNPTCNTLIGVSMVENEDYFQITRKHKLCRDCYMNDKLDPKLMKRFLQEK